METTSKLETREAASTPQNRVRGYFDETPAERRNRIRQTRDEEREERAAVIARCLQDEDWDGLTIAFQPLVRSYAFKLVRAFELDSATFDDLIQAGNVGLWKAVRSYDAGRGASFTTHAIRCARRNVWNEFDRMKNLRRGTSVAFGETAAEPAEERPSVESELADTEAIAYILHELSALPEDAQEAVLYYFRGETFNAIGKHQGKSLAGARNRILWAIEKVQEQVMPLMLGAWTPYPAAMGDAFEILNRLGCSLCETLPPLTEHVERHCEYCGEVIPTNNLKAKYCRRQCKDMAQYFRTQARKKAAAA